jgi:recombination protein RecT
MAQPNTTLTPATRPDQTPAQRQLNSIKAMLTSPDCMKSLASRLPRHLTADRMLKVALTAINKTPKLLECSRESLLLSIMQAAELGLEPGGALGEGYLVPYGNQCQFIPGYRGLISLARRSGQIISIEAHVVYQKDEFECGFGLDPFLKHTPAWEEADQGPLRFVYAVAKLKDGGVQFEVMSRAQIEKIRAASKAGRNGPWVDHFDEMARKTVVRRLFKYLPVSVELATALDLQAGAEAGEFTGMTIDADVAGVMPTLPDASSAGAQAPSEPPPPAADPVAQPAQAQPEQPTRRSRADALKQNLAPAAAAPVQPVNDAHAYEDALAVYADTLREKGRPEAFIGSAIRSWANSDAPDKLARLQQAIAEAQAAPAAPGMQSARRNPDDKAPSPLAGEAPLMDWPTES